MKGQDRTQKRHTYQQTGRERDRDRDRERETERDNEIQRERESQIARERLARLSRSLPFCSSTVRCERPCDMCATGTTPPPLTLTRFKWGPARTPSQTSTGPAWAPSKTSRGRLDGHPRKGRVGHRRT